MKDMSWLQPSVDRLNWLMQGGRVPHAILLNARLGNGAEALAMELATALLCDTPQMGYACGRCKDCQLMKAGSHPDFYRLDPEGASRSIKIDAVRAMVQRFGTTPQISRRKVALMVRADTLNHNAANALLKTLEEPPGNSVLMLQNEGQRPLLPTVRSRCQPLPVDRPSWAQSLAWLKAQGFAPGGSEDWLDMLRHEPLRIAAFLRDNQLEQWQPFQAIMEGVAHGSLSPVVAARQLEKSSIELDDQLNWIESAIHRHNCQRAQAGQPLAQRLPELQQQLLQIRRELTPGVSTNRLLLQEHLFTLWHQFNRLAAG